MKPFGVAFSLALLVIGVLVYTGFSSTKGNHLAPTGKIGKVRVHDVDANTSFAVIDFTAANDSDRDMIIRTISVNIDGVEGSAVASAALASAFKAYPELGEQFNPVLRERDTIAGHQSLDRMVGFRFDLPVSKLQNRTRLSLRIEDVTGPVLEMLK